jgi:hypothetical protein
MGEGCAFRRESASASNVAVGDGALALCFAHQVLQG